MPLGHVNYIPTSWFGIANLTCSPLELATFLPCSSLVKSVMGIFSGRTERRDIKSLWGDSDKPAIAGLTGDSPNLTKFPPTNHSPPLGLLALDPAINLSNLCSAVIELSPDPKSLLLPLGGLIRSYIPVTFLTSCGSWPTASYCRRSFRLWVNQCSNQVPWQWCTAYIRWPSCCYVLWVC